MLSKIITAIILIHGITDVVVIIKIFSGLSFVIILYVEARDKYDYL